MNQWVAELRKRVGKCVRRSFLKNLSREGRERSLLVFTFPGKEGALSWDVLDVYHESRILAVYSFLVLRQLQPAWESELFSFLCLLFLISSNPLLHCPYFSWMTPPSSMEWVQHFIASAFHEPLPSSPLTYKVFLGSRTGEGLNATMPLTITLS